MAKKSRVTRRRRTRRNRRSQRGGNYTSGSTYGTYVNGSGNSQFDRTFSSTGEFANRVGADYVGAQGQGMNLAGNPTAQNLSLIQSAGRRQRMRGMRGSKRGGFFGAVLSEAIVPATILGLQQSYGRGNKTFKRK